MKVQTKARIIAGFIIFALFVIYVVLNDAMGWKHGGGIVVIGAFMGAGYYIWKKASEIGEKKDVESTNANKPKEVSDSLDESEVSELHKSSKIPDSPFPINGLKKTANLSPIISQGSTEGNSNNHDTQQEDSLC